MQLQLHSLFWRWPISLIATGHTSCPHIASSMNTLTWYSILEGHSVSAYISLCFRYITCKIINTSIQHCLTQTITLLHTQFLTRALMLDWLLPLLSIHSIHCEQSCSVAMATTWSHDQTGSPLTTSSALSFIHCIGCSNFSNTHKSTVIMSILNLYHFSL